MNFQQDPYQGEMPKVNLSFQPSRWSRMAIISFTLSIASFLFLLWQSVGLNIIAAVLAIVFAIISRKKLGRWNGFAIAGLVIGIVSLVISIFLIVISIYMVVEAINHPDGEIAVLLDKYFYQTYGITFRDYYARIAGI